MADDPGLLDQITDILYKEWYIDGLSRFLHKCEICEVFFNKIHCFSLFSLMSNYLLFFFHNLTIHKKHLYPPFIGNND